MRRLYLHIYLMVIGAIIVFAIGAGFIWRYVLHDGPPAQGMRALTELVVAALPPATEPMEAQSAAIDRLATRVRADIGLFDAQGKLIVAAGQDVPPPDSVRGPGWVGGPGRRPAMSLALSDGRWLVVRFARGGGPPRPGLPFVGFLGLLAIAVAVGAYPAVRRVTRRLERLKAGVEALGAGHLKTRVPVVGKDEVAALAASFNNAASRIEELLGSQRTLLANASHELRSPLARIQMGVALLKAHARPELAAELERSVAELDQLVDEILLASRLDTVPDDSRFEPVDLLALAAEECARADATLDGVPTTIEGDPRLLRRLIRNLLDNAKRHGDGSDVTVSLTKNDPVRSELCVFDRGPGVPEAERERIFEPFYRPAGTSEATGGAGLGLSLVRTIARRHGGEARYVAQPGGGACFAVQLATA